MSFSPDFHDNAHKSSVAIYVIRPPNHSCPMAKILRIGSGAFISRRTVLTTWSVVRGRLANLLLISPDQTERTAKIVAASQRNNLAVLKLDNKQRGCDNFLSLAPRIPKMCTPVCLFGYTAVNKLGEGMFGHCGAGINPRFTQWRAHKTSRPAERTVLRLRTLLSSSWEGAPVVTACTGEVMSMVSEGTWMSTDIFGIETACLCGTTLPAMRNVIERANSSR